LHERVARVLVVAVRLIGRGRDHLRLRSGREEVVDGEERVRERGGHFGRLWMWVWAVGGGPTCRVCFSTTARGLGFFRARSAASGRKTGLREKGSRGSFSPC